VNNLEMGMGRSILRSGKKNFSRVYP